MSSNSEDDKEISRRRLLQGAGAGLGAGMLSDVSTATMGGGEQGTSSSENDLYNVGVRPEHKEEGVPTVKRAADTVVQSIDFEELGTVINGVFSPQAREGLRNNPHIEYVEPDFTDYSLHEESIPWGIDRIGALQLYTHDTIGAPDEATVAVLDTGVDSDHTDLSNSNISGKAWWGQDYNVDTRCGSQQSVTDCCPNQSRTCSGYNGNSCNQNWDDDDNHGTHVAGTIAADDDDEGVLGIAPGVDLLAGKVFDGCGNTSASIVSDAIKWATDQGADVINMSFGGGGSRTEMKACHYAHSRNVVLVAAAGNGGYCTDCVDAPAKYSTVIAVSNMTDLEGLRGDSSTGPEVEIAAPGNQILSTIPPAGDPDGDGYRRNGGTSMSSPHVAGVAALIKDLTTLSDNEDIRARLRESAENIDLEADDQGYGLVNALEATNSSLRESNPDRPQLTPFHTVFHIDDQWYWFPFDEEFTDPVVVAGPATHDESDPTTVRVRNVDSETNTAEVRLQEWDYLDSDDHTTEDVSIAVFENARDAELNGSKAETGHVYEMDTDWQVVEFKEPFPEDTTPIVIPQVVTENGSDAVTVRVRNVKNTGFETRLQEQESNEENEEGHSHDERVDYLAVLPHANFDSEAGRTDTVVDHTETSVSLSRFDNRPDLLAQIQTVEGKDPCNLRVNDWDATGFDVVVDEEDSTGDGTTHNHPESVGYVALEPFDDEGMVYETGTGEIDQPDGDTWHPVRSSAALAYFDPVVLMGPPTHEGDNPTTVRVRNIGTSPTGAKSFEFQLDEWAYLNSQSHTTEKISYGIFEAGTGTIGPANVEAGYRVDVDDSWTTILFEEGVFDSPPVVIVQCTTQSGDDPVTVRVRNVSETGFTARLQEEEAQGRHSTERIDYLAIEPVVDGTVEASKTGNIVDEEPPTRVEDVFDEFQRPPDLLASMQTTDGGDTAAARLTGWGTNSFSVFIEEEQSADTETNHTTETVGYAAFEHDGPEQIAHTSDTVSHKQEWSRQWKSVSTGLFNNPVVVMGPPTHSDPNPTTVRVRDHQIDGFEFQFDNWNYLDGTHGSESISYAMFEGGVGTIDAAGNARAEVSAVAADENWEEVRFSLTANFEKKPVVIAQVSSEAGLDPVTVRIRNVTTDGFEARVQEEESQGGHLRERIDYIAVEPVETDNLTVGRADELVDHTETTVELDGFANVPNVLAQTQTFNGADPCNLRMTDVDMEGFGVFVDEEDSADDGTTHNNAEEVGFIAFDE